MKKYKLKETKKNVTEFDAGLNLYAYKEENQNYLFLKVAYLFLNQEG